NRAAASRTKRTAGSWTTSSYRGLFASNHSLRLFFSSSRKNSKKPGVKYPEWSAIWLVPCVRSPNERSAVEHWRERAGVEDGPDRADLVSADPVPFADEGRTRGRVRHHVVEDADVVPVDERSAGSTRSTMWCSLPRASRYGSGRWNDSNGPTNDKSSWRYVRAPAMSPLPSAFWYAVTMSFAFAIYSRSFGNAGASCQAA